MNVRSTLLTAGNAALYLTTCAIAGTGLLLELRLDDEDGVHRLFGMGTDDWGEIHFALALAFVGLAVLHLALNWPWINATLKHRQVTLMLLGLGVLFVMGLLLWPVEHSRTVGGVQQQRHERNDD